jgi:hypothetical protein
MERDLKTKKTTATAMNMPAAIKRKAVYGAMALALGLSSASAFAAQSIVFIGNSFTYGDRAPNVQRYQPSTVTDLNGSGIGGMPSLFKAFTVQAGLDYNVSLETAGGTGFKFHWDNKRALLNQQPWDAVVMHGFSTLSSTAPGNPSEVIDYGNRLAQMFTATNPNVDVNLMATWSRADQTYNIPSGVWYGKPITQMAIDVAAGYAEADRQSDAIDDVIPVGLAWNRAIETGFADANPYDGIEGGKVNLWGNDSYHGSMYGYYLEALTVFGNVTGLDPRSLGSNEKVAMDLGITGAQAAAMQQIAFDQLAASAVPEPSTIAMFGLGMLGLFAARRKAGKVVTR